MLEVKDIKSKYKAILWRIIYHFKNLDFLVVILIGSG